MAVSVFKTFSAGEVLTASDLNSSLTQITSNGTDVAFPLTKNSSLGGFSLFTDAANTKSMTDSAKGVNLVLTAFNDAKTTVASATTPDIWTGTGRLIDYTGTVTATGFAAASQAGSRRTLLCAGAAPFTAGANMLIDGYLSAATFTATAGDEVDVLAVTTTQFRLRPRRYSGGSLVPNYSVCDHRLSLGGTGVPVTTTDVSGATFLYVEAYKGTRIGLFDGANWNVRSTAQIVISTSGLSSDTNYDVFVFDNAGVPTAETLAWSTDTARATALAYQDGVLSKTGALTRRYLGTFRFKGGGFYDSVAFRYVWNYYNRVRRPMLVTEATDSWTYTTATLRQARATATNQLDFVIGVAEDTVTAEVYAFYSNSTAGVGAFVAIGLDSTSALATGCLVPSGSNGGSNYFSLAMSAVKTIPAAGRHTLVWLEYSAATGTTTWYGDNASPTLSQSGIQGEIWA